MTVHFLALDLATRLIRAEAITCPDCDGALEVTEATAIELRYGGNRTTAEGPRRVERPTTVAACTRCEFILDLREAVR